MDNVFFVKFRHFWTALHCTITAHSVATQAKPLSEKNRSEEELEYDHEAFLGDEVGGVQ